MNQTLLTLSHGPLHWEQDLPPGFKGVRLPGGNVSSATGEFGSVCIQEYLSDHFSIRYKVFDILHRFVIKTLAPETGLHSLIMLKGQSALRVNQSATLTLRSNQFLFLNLNNTEIITTLEKNLHHSFETFFTPYLVNEVKDFFPSFRNELILKSGPLSFPKWADAETLQLPYSILRCKYEKQLRRYYFESKVKDLLFNCLLQFMKTTTEEKISEDELQSIYKAEEIINENIATHIHIPELSKKVALNEFRLKKLFKIVFGMGPYEYLVQKRLEEGKRLLESGFSVKETAAKIGYRPSDFTTSFRNYFGFPPSAIKKN